MESFDDLFYIQRVKAGDIQAFSPIVSHYQRMVFSAVIRIADNREDAEDITQEVFIKAFKSLNQFKEESGFSTWLYRIAYNTTISEVRRRKIVFTSIDDHLTSIQDEAIGDKIDDIETKEKLQYLDEALKHLSPDEVWIITLFYLNDQSMNEISQITHLTVANLKVKLHRIRKKIAVIMNQLMAQ